MFAVLLTATAVRSQRPLCRFIEIIRVKTLNLDVNHSLPVPVAARSKAWVCGRSLAGIVGSNPAGDMNVCLL